MSGVLHGLIASLGGTPRTWTYVGSSSSIDQTVSYPSGTQSGDLLVYLDGAAGEPQTYVAPTGGWNSIAESTVNYFNPESLYATVAAYWLIASSGSGSVGPGYTQTATNKRKMMLAFRPNSPISQIRALDIDSVMGTTAPSGQTISAASSSAPVLCIAHSRRSNAHPATWPANMTRVVGSSDQHIAGYTIQNTTSANITVETNLPSGTANFVGLQSFYIIGTG